MRYISLSNANLAIPDEIVYLSDSIMVTADYLSSGSSTMAIVIDGDAANTLTVQLTDSTTATADLSYWLRARYSHRARVPVQVTLTLTAGGTTTTATATFEILLMYGKTYPDRTHYAERAAYIPEDGYPLEVMTPLPAVVTTDAGDTLTLDAGEIGEIKSDCANALTVDFAALPCVDDCGWGYAVESLHLYAHKEGRSVIYKLILTPTDTLNKWRIMSQASIPLPNSYLNTDLFAGGIVWGVDAVTLTEYNYGGVATGDKWVLVIDQDHPMTYYIDQEGAEAAFGLSPASETVTQIVVTADRGGHSALTVYTATDSLTIKVSGCPSYSYISTMLYNAGWSSATCRHAAALYGVAWVGFGNPSLDGNQQIAVTLTEIGAGFMGVRCITHNGGDTYDGAVSVDDVFFSDFDGTATVCGRTIDKSRTRYHLLAPSCYGYFRRDDGVRCYPLVYIPAAGRLLLTGGGVIDTAVAADTPMYDMWRALEALAGTVIYDRNGTAYTYVAASACCDEMATSYQRGELWCMTDAESYTIELRRACFDGCRGLWLQYYNADGLIRWLPMQLNTAATTRDRYDYKVFDDEPARWLPGAVTTAVARVLEVVALDIPETIYAEDVMTSPELYVCSSDLSIMTPAVVITEEVVRDSERGTRDYLFKIKTLC